MSNKDYGFYEENHQKEVSHNNKQGKKSNFRNYKGEMNRGGNMEDKGNNDSGNQDYNSNNHYRYNGRKNYGYNRKNDEYGKKQKKKKRDMDHQQQYSNF